MSNVSISPIKLYLHASIYAREEYLIKLFQEEVSAPTTTVLIQFSTM